MLSFLAQWAVASVAFWLSAQMIPGVRLKDFKTAIIASAIYATLCALLSWLLATVFLVATLGFGLLVLPLVLWVTGTILLMVTDAILEDFEMNGFGTALITSLVVAILSTVGNVVIQGIF